MINMGIMVLKQLVFIKTFAFLMQMIFLNIFLEITPFKMMTTMIFLVAYLVKGKAAKGRVLEDLDLALAYLNLNHFFKMTIFLLTSVVEVIFLLLNLLHLMTKA